MVGLNVDWNDCMRARSSKKPSSDFFPNFFDKQKVARARGLAKNLQFNFNKQISKAKIRSQFAKICTPFAKCRLPKKVYNLTRVKNSRANIDEIDASLTTFFVFHFSISSTKLC
jgi:hypothetical protein